MPNISEDMSKLEQETQELVMKLRELNKQIGSSYISRFLRNIKLPKPSSKTVVGSGI